MENGLKGVVDLVKMKAIYFDGDSGETLREEDVPADMKQFCIEKKLELIGSLAEFDE